MFGFLQSVFVYCVKSILYAFVQNGITSLLSAAWFGHLHIVRDLIEKMNADVLAQTTVC